MRSIEFNINTDAAVKHTNRLEQMHRSALPNAVRGTLNGMALDVKKDTMPKEASRAFTQRRDNFFKATSRVDFATGYNVRSMQATVGFIGGEKNQAVEDLEAQEHGGIIKGRAFIPKKGARIGKSKSRAIAGRNRTTEINNIVNAKKGRIKGKTAGSRFNKAVHIAGIGGHVLAPYRGQMLLWRVDGISKDRSKKHRLTLLYSYAKSRIITIKKPTHFMERATTASAKKGDNIYEKEMDRQLKRLQ